MPVVKEWGPLVRVVAFSLAGAAIGCGGSLTGNPGTAGTGGAPTGEGMGRGGRAGTSGSAGASGTTGAGGGGVFGEPACPATVTKGAACGSSDPQLCYKTCGPEKTGVKSEICSTGGVYSEMSGCAFDPGKDFSCYAIPAAANVVCPAGTPQASAECDVPTCTLCNSTMGLAGGQFMDASGAIKIGYCVCQGPNAAGLRTWSCASDTAWPCPLGAGCSPIFTGIGGVGGGGSGAAGASGEFGQPACPSTVARAGSCTPEDVQFCYKRCGPESIGVKSETCAGSVYAEMSGCTFDPAGDYACYKIPTAANAACPAGILQPNNPCSVAPCTLCNSAGGTANGTYTDSAGVERPGYCVCAATGKWSCVAATSWPCPAGAGC